MASYTTYIAIVIAFLAAYFFVQTQQQVQVSDETKKLVRNYIDQNKIFIATKSYCPYCRRVTTLLSDWKVNEAKVLPLDLESNGSEIQAALTQLSGSRTVPSIWLNGEFVQGGSEGIARLVKNGEWKQFLEQNNIPFSEPKREL